MLKLRGRLEGFNLLNRKLLSWLYLAFETFSFSIFLCSWNFGNESVTCLHRLVQNRSQAMDCRVFLYVTVWLMLSFVTELSLVPFQDLSDLFGSDVPVVTDEGSISFRWEDGPVLRAIKRGEWVLLDEVGPYVFFQGTVQDKCLFGGVWGDQALVL